MTEKAHLYINSKGYPVTRHSYSASDTFSFCAQKYKLARVDGWTEKTRNASQKFGIAFEDAIRYYHETDLDLSAALLKFATDWAVHFADTELHYTATESSWEALNNSGRELLQLYALRLPSLPILTNPVPKFQIQYSKEVFPGTKLAGIEFIAYVDMIARAKENYSIGLQLVGTGPRKILIDIKTSGVALDTTPGILALDQQLRTYAWVADIETVAFLWFVKTSRAIEKGSWISLLADAGKFRAGDRAVVIKFQEAREAEPADPEKPKSKPKAALPEEIWIVHHTAVIEEMVSRCGGGQTKAEKEARDIFIRENATLVAKENITKQRIQFETANISLADRAEAATSIGHDIAQIVYANENNQWPKQGGVRFPNNKCGFCSMRGICLNNAELRDELVERKDDELKEIKSTPAAIPESEQMEFAMSEFD